MIKAGGNGPGGAPALFIGLTIKDVAALADGRAVRIRDHELLTMGLPALHVVISAADTDEGILSEWAAAGLVRPDVKVVGEPAPEGGPDAAGR